MKLLKFNRNALLKALRLCALLLAYAAAQNKAQANIGGLTGFFTPSLGTPGNDNVIGNGTYTDNYFYGNGGFDTINVKTGASDTLSNSNSYIIKINAGSVTNNGSLSNYYYTSNYGIEATNGSAGLTTVTNSSGGSISVSSTYNSTGIYINNTATAGTVQVLNKGSISAYVQSDSNTDLNAYGVNVHTSLSSINSDSNIFVSNKGLISAFTSENNVGSTTAGAVTASSYSKYGHAGVQLNNSGNISAHSGSTYGKYGSSGGKSLAYGMSGSSYSFSGQASSQLNNSGLITAVSGASVTEPYSKKQKAGSDVYGMKSDSGTYSGSAYSGVTNSGSITAAASYSGYRKGNVTLSDTFLANINVTLGNSSNATIGIDNSSNAYGIYASSNSSYGGNLQAFAGNSGSITVRSGTSAAIGYVSNKTVSDNLSTRAYGISSSAYGKYGNDVADAINTGTVSSTSGMVFSIEQNGNGTFSNHDSSSAYGIRAHSQSTYGNASTNVANGGSISATAGYMKGNYTIGKSLPPGTLIGGITFNGTGAGYISAYGIEAAALGYGFTSTLVSNSGNITASSGSTYSAYSKGAFSVSGPSRSYGISANSHSDYGNAVTGVYNSGTINATTGSYYFKGNNDQYAYGIYAGSLSPQGNAETVVANTGSISAVSSYSKGNLTYSYGISASSYSEYGTANVTVMNSGSVYAKALTGKSNATLTTTEATGIYAGASANGGATSVTIFNGGNITVDAYSDSGPAYAYGIQIGYPQNVPAVPPSVNNHLNTITNTGIITTSSSSYAYGIFVRSGVTTVNNTGGTIISNTPHLEGSAIYLANTPFGNTVNLNGISRITGNIYGGAGGNDTLNLNLIGITAAKKAELQSYLSGLASGDNGTFTAAGQTYDFVGFEHINLNAKSFHDLIGNSGLNNFADTLDNINGDIGPKLAQLLSAAGMSSDSAQVLSQMAGQDVLNAINGMDVTLINQLGQTLSNRGWSLRNGAEGVDFTGFQVNDASQLAAVGQMEHQLNALNLLAGTDMDKSVLKSDVPEDTGVRSAKAKLNDWGAWLTGSATLATQDERDGSPGYNTTSYGATLGMDRRISDHTVLGLLGGYSHDRAYLSGGGGVKADSAIAGVYADYAEDGWHAEGLGAYVHTGYGIDRKILGTDSSGDTDGNTGAVLVSGGYDFNSNGWKIGPSAGLQYAHSVIDAYNQSGSALALNVGEQTIDSLQSILGVELSREFDLKVVKLTPQIWANWHHEFMDDSNTTSASFQNAPAIGSFTVDSRSPERDFALVGGTLSGVMPDLEALSFFLGYNAQVGQSSYIAHSVNGGLKVSF